jgi:hypothetical protein
MVSNTCIPPLTEIFNTYGEDLTNAQLLSQYGFILDMNDNDRVSWTAAEVLRILTPGQCDDSELKGILTDLRQALPLIPLDHALFEHSQLVHFNPLTIDEFCVNSEGKISHHLWILLLLLACKAMRPCTEFGINSRRLLDLQLDLESIETLPDGFDPELLGLLVHMSSSIATLCSERSGKSTLELFELLDVSLIICVLIAMLNLLLPRVSQMTDLGHDMRS